MKRLFVLLCVTTLAGCAHVNIMPHQDPDPTLPEAPIPSSQGLSGGVFAPNPRWSLVSDTRSYQVGDVITVMLEETTQASKRSGTRFGKDSSASFKPTLIGDNIFNTKVGISAGRNFEGSASSSQQNSLSGAITVVVNKVYANGLLLVKGEKELTLNQGEEFVKLAGFVRVDDIDADNRVSSLRIADARITYSGRGALNDANATGWLTRFFTSPFMPF